MRRLVFAALSLTLLAGTPLVAQTGSDRLKKTVEETVEIQKETQQHQDQWEKDKAALVARYRAARSNVDFLLERKAVEQKRLTAMEQSIAEMNRRLEESDRLSDSIQDTLNAIYGRLEDWVRRDLPFAKIERETRLEYLKKDLVRPDKTDADKLRRLLEVMQIEMNYGATVEVTQQQIELEGEDLFVDLLRIGRVSVFWRTSDGKRCGEYDRGVGGWVEFPGKRSHAIGEAMEMASRIRPVELISLPLGRIQP
jgi:hypothetical protein